MEITECRWGWRRPAARSGKRRWWTIPVGLGTGEEKHNDRGELAFGVRSGMRWYGSSFMMHMNRGVWEYGMMYNDDYENVDFE